MRSEMRLFPHWIRMFWCVYKVHTEIYCHSFALWLPWSFDETSIWRKSYSLLKMAVTSAWCYSIDALIWGMWSVTVVRNLSCTVTSFYNRKKFQDPLYSCLAMLFWVFVKARVFGCWNASAVLHGICSWIIHAFILPFCKLGFLVRLHPLWYPIVSPLDEERQLNHGSEVRVLMVSSDLSPNLWADPDALPSVGRLKGGWADL